GTYDQLYTFVIFAAVLFYALAGASVIVLRRRHPEWSRPYRTWGYPVTPIVYVGVCVIVLVYTLVNQPVESGWGLASLACGLPAAKRIDEHARVLTENPHVAGTPENDAVARYILERFQEAGLETSMKSYQVYLGYVKSALLEEVEPETKRLTNPEEGTPEDKDASNPRAALTWNAYSPSCDLTREVVYANHARPEDFDALDRLGVSVKDRLVLARYFNGYRGGKAQEAERRGDAAVIVKSRPGPAVPAGWQGGLPLTYDVGPGPSRLHLRIEASFETRAITDVIGILRGSDEPDRQIILGNHHDAWVYGAVDPS